MELIKKSQNIKKHIGTIHIGNSLTLLERKLFNVLLLNAYHDLPKTERYEIPVSLLCNLLGFDSKNIDHLKEALTKLSTTKIEWVVLDSDKKEKQWGVSTFIAGGVIEDSICKYGYFSFLREKLYNPDVYARINLEVQRDFESKYALALYENCIRFRPNQKKNFKGLTAKWTLDQFRQLMGVEGKKSYLAIRDLKKRIINPAVEEVNGFSDIIIEPVFHKNGRKISEINFEVKDNPQLRLNLKKDNPSDIENPIIVKFKEYGISEMLTMNWLETYGEDYLNEKLDLCKKNLLSGKIRKNVGGFLVKAIQGDYKDTDPKEEQKRIEHQKMALKMERDKKAYERQEFKKRKQEIKDLKAKKRDKAVTDFFESMPKSQQEKIIKEYEEQEKGSFILEDKERFNTLYKAGIYVYVRKNYFDEESFVKTQK